MPTSQPEYQAGKRNGKGDRHHSPSRLAGPPRQVIAMCRGWRRVNHYAELRRDGQPSDADEACEAGQDHQCDEPQPMAPLMHGTNGCTRRGIRCLQMESPPCGSPLSAATLGAKAGRFAASGAPGPIDERSSGIRSGYSRSTAKSTALRPRLANRRPRR